jgi:hypothetical protein
MNRRRVALGLCMACALLVSAVAASGAQAAATAVTCAPASVPGPESTVGFEDKHCKVGAANHAGQLENVKFEHSAAAVPTTLSGEKGTQFSGQQTLRATINGINTELQTTAVSGSGTLETNSGGTVSGTGTITYTGVEVLAPAGKGCKVYTDNGGSKGEEGVVHTNTLSASTTSPGELKFTPAAGETFATFIIDGCGPTEALKGLNKTYSVTGSVVGTVTGAETSSTHAGVTGQKTLKLNGSIISGLNGSITIKGEGTPLALT